MSYATILAGLHERFTTVSGINFILAYAPTAIPEPPILYSLLDSVEITGQGSGKATHYRIQHRMIFRWQDYEQAELELMPFVDAIPAAVEADPHLGGAIVSGWARIEQIEAGWIEIGGVDYRVLDFYSDVVVK